MQLSLAQLFSKNTGSFRTVDYFAGFGGFSEAAKMAGERAARLNGERSSVSIDVAINHHETALRVHRLNHGALTLCEDLITFDHSSIGGQVQLLLAAPACQGHSQCARPARRNSETVREYHDTLRSTAFSVVNAVRKIRPTAILVENVPQFSCWEGFDLWLSSIEEYGYRCKIHRLMASDFGVPQLRERLFISGVSSGMDVQVEPTTPGARVPASTCIDWDGEDPSLRGSAGVWKPLSATKSKTAYQKRVKALDRYPRGVLVYAYSHDSVHPAFAEPWRTITTKTPSQVVIVRSDGMYRRPLPVEVARAMGFDESFSIPAGLSLADIDRGFGGAVCPPVGAAAIGAVVKASPTIKMTVAA